MPSFTPEWRLLDPVADLEALRLYLDTVEEQLAFLQDQWQVRLTADLKDATKDERDWLWHESQMREAHVTKSLRGGFIISLWASYESGILDVADFLKDEKGLRLRLSDVRGDLFNRARKYFDSVLVFPLHPDLNDWTPLQVLHDVRNTYAHANGRLGRTGKNISRGRLFKPDTKAHACAYRYPGVPSGKSRRFNQRDFGLAFRAVAMRCSSSTLSLSISGRIFRMNCASSWYTALRPMRAPGMLSSASRHIRSASRSASSACTARPHSRHSIRVQSPSSISFIPVTGPQQFVQRPSMSALRAGPTVRSSGERSANCRNSVKSTLW